jgi:hypothetical protein
MLSLSIHLIYEVRNGHKESENIKRVVPELCAEGAETAGGHFCPVAESPVTLANTENPFLLSFPREFIFGTVSHSFLHLFFKENIVTRLLEPALAFAPLPLCGYPT